VGNKGPSHDGPAIQTFVIQLQTFFTPGLELSYSPIVPVKRRLGGSHITYRTSHCGIYALIEARTCTSATYALEVYESEIR